MDFIFIKAGGSGNIIRDDNVNIDYDRLYYRQQNIDVDYFKILIDNICQLATEKKIGFIIGGVGAYLYINFAKNLNIKSNRINKVGADIINITSEILLEVFLQKKANVYPKLVDVDSNFEKLFRNFDLILFQSNEKYWSTDSIVAYAASKFDNSILIFFKTNLALRIMKDNSMVNIHYLKSLAINSERNPGSSSLIDLQALDIIEQKNIKTVICEKELITKLSRISNNTNNNTLEIIT